MRKKNFKIKTIVFINTFIVIALSLIILGFFVINIAYKKFSSEIATQLKTQVILIKSFIEDIDIALEDSIEKSKQKAEKDLKSLIDNTLKEIKQKKIRSLTELKEILSKQKIGEKGYFYLLDNNGLLLIHPTNEGKSLKGQPHIEEILSKKNGFIRYTRTTDPTKPVVYASYSYLEDYNAILVATINENDYIGEAGVLTQKVKEKVKTVIKNTKIGTTGYYYIIDSKGVLIVHPKKEGENVSNFDFIKEILNKKTGVIRYPWEGRYKIVAFEYYKNLDWIITAGSYEDEFIGDAIKNIKFWFAVISLIIMIILFFVINFIFTKFIGKPLSILSEDFKTIASGDLSKDVAYKRKDEMGMIIENVEDMKHQMNNTLFKVKRSADSVTNSSNTIDLSSKEMSKAIEHLTNKVSQVEVAIHEMSATIQEITNNIADISNEVTSVKDLANNGRNDLLVAVQYVKTLSTSVSKSGENIQKLGEASKEIGTILEVIREIADQTNLLALNAAIEAARAGEFGRGFAVVADEIRKLAERTTKSISEINTMINNIQKEVNNSVNDVYGITKSAQESVIIIEKLNQSFSKILDGVVEIADKINSVATAVEQQSSAASEISSSMSEVSAVAEENASIAEQNRMQAENLRELAKDLLNLVAQFKLKEC